METVQEASTKSFQFCCRTVVTRHLTTHSFKLMGKSVVLLGSLLWLLLCSALSWETTAISFSGANGLLHNGNKTPRQKRVGGWIISHWGKYKRRSVPERMEGKKEGVSIQTKKQWVFFLFGPKVEPFYVVLSLFDVQNGRKISANFDVDLNHPLVRQMTLSSGSCGKDNRGDSTLGCHRLMAGLPEGALRYPKQGVFSVTCPHPEIFLVARVEKVLQGGIAHCTEPYMKSSDSAKVDRRPILLLFNNIFKFKKYIFKIKEKIYIFGYKNV